MEKGKRSLIISVVVLAVIAVVVFTTLTIRKSSNGVYGTVGSDTTEVVIDTTEVVSDNTLEIITVLDTVEIYRVIVGSFKVEMNSYGLSELLTTSEVVIRNGYFMVSKSYHYNLEDAKLERDSLEKGTWILKDTMIIEK